MSRVAFPVPQAEDAPTSQQCLPRKLVSTFKAEGAEEASS